ncbi:hypothetical protein R3P38DRAFT_490019 [Favolaschia claudopus]|uniref:Secreted protein n=1 Tax=Favolaschia claudopus TaxID=2862362 RepID=A0AAW0CJA7_9AGAR
MWFIHLLSCLWLQFCLSSRVKAADMWHVRVRLSSRLSCSNSFDSQPFSNVSMNVTVEIRLVDCSALSSIGACVVARRVAVF